MKNKFFLAAMAMGAFLIVGASSCSSDDMEDLAQPAEREDIVSGDNPSGKILLTFAAGDGDYDATLQKTIYGEKSGSSTPVLWETGDLISVFPVSGGSNDQGTVKEGGASECEISVTTTNADGYFALYPYNANAAYSDNKFSGVAIPSSQTVSKGQFDPQADVMVAYASGTGKEFSFKHIGTKLGITIPVGLNGVKSIILSCSEKIAGVVDVDYTSSSTAPKAAVKSGCRHVTLTCDDPDGFLAGETYYACLLPTAGQSSIKIAFYTADDKTEGKFARGAIAEMVRAKRCTAAPGAGNLHGMLKITLDELCEIWELSSDYENFVFGYYSEQDESVKKIVKATEIFPTIYVGTDKSTRYILSDDEICLSGSLETMFWSCENLKTIDFSNFNTGNVTSMVDMFQCCYGLSSLDLSGFNTENVTDMNGMFNDCSLESLDLSSFNTKSVMNMDYMFYYNYLLSDVTVSKDFIIPSNCSVSYMFYGCDYISSIDDFTIIP